MLRLFDYQELPQVDQIISLYMRLDDAHRSQFMDMGNYLAEKGTPPVLLPTPEKNTGVRSVLAGKDFAELMRRLPAVSCYPAAQHRRHTE